MSNYIKNGTFNHGAWQRDQILNEGPGNDPALKSLRTRIPGEKFPELSTWWEYQPEDIMTYVYWHQGQLPPTGPKFEKEWNNIVKQLHAKYPVPAEALPKLDVDDRTERELSVDAPDRFAEATGQVLDPTKPFMPGQGWSNDFDYTGMLKYGASATYEGIGGEMDVEELKALYESFTDVNYHTEAKDLGNALDWIEDQGTDANRAQEMIEGFMESFRMACMKTLKEWGVKFKPGGKVNPATGRNW